MGIKFKKVTQGEHACIYGLTEDISSVEYQQVVDWLNTHCPNAYEFSSTHLFINRDTELFFELTFTVE